MHGSKFPELILSIVIQRRAVGETCFIHSWCYHQAEVTYALA